MAEEPRKGRPFSSAELRTFMKKGRFYSYLDKRLSIADKAFVFDDFDQGTLNADYWSGATLHSDATIAAIAIPGGTTMAGAAHGILRMSSATSNATTQGQSLLFGNQIWFATNNCAIEARFRVTPAATTAVGGLMFEFGFAVTTGAATRACQVSDVDTPAGTGANFGVIQIDMSQTLKSLSLVTKGSAGTTYQIKATTLPKFSGAQTTHSGTTAAVVFPYNTFVTCRVEMLGSSVFAYINGELMASHNTLVASGTAANWGGYVDPITALRPWMYVNSATAEVNVIDVDYVAVWEDRVGGG